MFSKMEEKHRELLQRHRTKFVQSVEVERLYPILQNSGVLGPKDTEEIGRMVSPHSKVEKLLDILPNKGGQAFKSLCLALETTYPHLLTVMFLGSNVGSSQSTVSSYTSESDIEVDTKSPRLLMSPGQHSGHDLCQENLRLLKAEYKLVTDERDQYKSELDHYKLRLIQQQSSGSVGSMDETGTQRSWRDSHSSRDYDRLKEECQQAKKDVGALNHRYMEISRKCKNYATACERQSKELRAYEQECFDLKTEKRRAQQEIIDLKQLHDDDKRELNALRDMINQRGSSEVLNKMYDTAIEKYDAMKKSYDELRRRYLDKDEELARLRSKYDTKQQEHEQVVKDLGDTRQKFTAMILSRDELLRERERERDESKKAQWKAEKQRNEAMKEIENARAVMVQAKKDLARVTMERNDAMQEYTSVMSERDVVHKEIEALQDEVQAEKKKWDKHKGETDLVCRERDALKHELQVIMKERDQVMRKIRDLDQKYNDVKTDKVEVLRERDKARIEFEKFKYERDIARKERTEAMEERDKILRECYDVKQLQQFASSNFEHAHKEIDHLKKEVERLQEELKDSSQEADIAKQRRDWAFNERDKIVMERESIRTLCDKLRRERDRAVSDLAEALRDSDDIKRLKNVATKELKDIKTKMQAQEENQSQMRQLIAHHSRDSAIDADSGEWETETVELETEEENVANLGFEIGEAKSNPQSPDDCSIYITRVDKGSIADGRLKVNDCLVKVNNVDLTNVDPLRAIQAVRSGGGVLNMVIKRKRPSSGKVLQPIRFNLGQERDHGITFEQGIFISRLSPQSPASRDGNLTVGDRVINVNGSPVENKSASDVEKLLIHAGDSVSLSILKSPTTSTGNSMIDSLKEKDLKSSRSSLVPSPLYGDSFVHVHDPKPIKHISTQTEELCYATVQTTNKYCANAKTEETFNIHSKSSAKSYQQQEPQQKPQKQQQKLIQSFAKEVSNHSEPPAPPAPRIKESPKYRDPPSFVPPPPPTESPDDDSKLASLPRFRKHPRKHGGRGYQKEESGGTWPKSQGPPEMYELEGQGVYIIHRRPKERATILANGYEWVYAPRYKDTSNGETPPIPPDRNSSLKASFRHSRQSSTHSSDSASTLVADNLTPNHTPTPSSVTITPNHTPSSSVVTNGPPTQNLNGMNKLSEKEKEIIHFQSNSTPATPVDFSVVSAYTAVTSTVENRTSSAPLHDRKDDNMRPHSVDVSMMPKPTQLELNDIYSPKTVLPPLVPSDAGFCTEASLAPGVGYMNGTQIRTSPHSHPSPHVAMTTVLRFKSVPFFTANSRVVSPANQPAIATGPPVPRYSTQSPKLRSKPVSPLERDRDRGGSDSPNSILSEEFSSGSPGSSLHDIKTSLDMPYSPLHSPQKSGHRSMTSHYHSYDGNDHSSLPANLNSNREYNNYKGRIKIPANPRKSPSILSSSSFDKSTGSSISMTLSDRSSPISPTIPEHSVPSSQSSDSSLSRMSHQGSQVISRHLHPRSEEPRHILIEKTVEPLGIYIKQGPKGGIFVQSVSDGSQAAKHGLEEGDQILEYNGINLRCATYPQAANILRQGGDSITILAQYNPKKMNSNSRDSSSSAQSTPTATPGSTATNSPTTSQSQMSESGTMTPPSPASCANLSMSPVLRSRLISDLFSPTKIYTGQKYPMYPSASPSIGIGTLSGSMSDTLSLHSLPPPSEPRFVFLKKTSPSLGIGIIGGNAVGIFVSDIQPDSVANSPDGLQQGDQILEFNGMDLRSATAEQAALELQKPTETVSILAQSNIPKFKKIIDQPCDAFYIKAYIDRQAETEGELNIRKDHVYFIDDTMFKGNFGMWRAWAVGNQGERWECGHILSKLFLEQEIMRKRSFSEGLAEDELRNASSRRGSASARRSFFRRKKHQRNNSKDSRELSSMDGSISTSCDSVPIQEDFSVPTYQRVERLDSKVKRPVLLLGPFVYAVSEKLNLESPNKFNKCSPEIMRASVQTMEKGISDCLFVDYRKSRDHFECITVSAIKEIASKDCHCILDICPSAVERLHRIHLFPIVIFMKHKSAKQIKELKDPRFLSEKLSMKQAKEMFEIACRMENEFRHLFTAIVQGGNLARLCLQVKRVVDQEQAKTLWVPSGNYI